MSKEYEDLKKEREKLNAAVNSPKPNNEQIQAHICDTIAKARKSLQKDIKFFEGKLKEIVEQS
jgi:hypothetical protein